MEPREKILAALKHEESNRIPRDLGGTESSGITAYALNNLHKHLHLSAEIKIFDPYQYVAYAGDELSSKFGIDTTNLTREPKHWVKQRNQHGFEVMLPGKWTEEISENGETMIRDASGEITAWRPQNGYYFDPVNPPLQNIVNSAELDNFKETIANFDLPSFADESLDDMRARAQVMRKAGRCVVFNLCCHILAAGQLLRGYENFMIDLLTDEPMVKRLLDYLIEGYCRRVDLLAPKLKDVVDVILLNDDLGTQHGPMLSLADYRKMIKPSQRELFSYVKRAFGKPILFHSCGAVRQFIPDLIEVGVDALNPVQLTAEGMDLKQLKQDFGRDITFWGGGIDTQGTLNKKSPDEVEEAVRRNVEIMAPGGGFVFCQVHNIQPDVPPENIIAMYKGLE